MKINLKKLELHPREREVFHLEEAGRDALLDVFGGKFVEPVKVELQVSNTGNMFVAQGRIQTVLQLPCSRCLTEIRFPVDTELFIKMIDAVQKGDADPLEDIIFSDLGSVDIEPSVEEAIFMQIPINPLCAPDCKGICPNCGVNQNIEECRCKSEDIDPRWEKLKNLQ